MAEKAGKNRSDYKRVNRGLVLRMIATGQCSTRGELARCTGLSKMAISNIVTEMLRQGLLAETAHLQSGEELGRPPVCLAVSPDAPKLVGLVIHRDRCDAVLCDLNMNRLRQASLPMEPEMNQDKLLDMVYRLLDGMLTGAERVPALGLASVGPVSVQTGRILKPYYFYGIENVELVQTLEARYGLPVFFDHDNQCAALAESLYGAGRGCEDMLFVGVGTGVGCGILSNGRLYGNRRGLPPEFGHMSIDVHGRPCQCGSRGCIEAYLRTPAMLEQLREETGRMDSYEAFCCAEGDEAVDRVFREAVDRLAAALVSIVNILNSQRILLGNDCALWPDRYLQQLEEQVNRRRFVAWDQPVTVRRASFGRDAALIGAACSAAARIFAGNLLFED